MEKQHLLSLNWPPALIKAIDDPFEYQITLRNGDIWTFERAEYLNNDFVKLCKIKNCTELPRGIEVRVSEITSIADAPYGV